MALLHIEGLTVAYGPIIALRDLHLEVHAGEMVALVGNNGAGKTSALRAISGLVRPQRGVVRFDGRPVQGLSASAIVRCGIVHVPEGRLLFADQTVEENLRLGAFLRHFSPDRRSIERDLRALEARFPLLAERRHQRAGTLSGGEQQLLAIARALMARPRLLLLDEPTLGLAPKLAAEVLELIAGLRNEGLTVLLAEQRALPLVHRADRAYLLEAGQCVASGTIAELFPEASQDRAPRGPSLGPR